MNDECKNCEATRIWNQESREGKWIYRDFPDESSRMIVVQIEGNLFLGTVVENGKFTGFERYSPYTKYPVIYEIGFGWHYPSYWKDVECWTYLPKENNYI